MCVAAFFLHVGAQERVCMGVCMCQYYESENVLLLPEIGAVGTRIRFRTHHRQNPFRNMNGSVVLHIAIFILHITCQLYLWMDLLLLLTYLEKRGGAHGSISTKYVLYFYTYKNGKCIAFQIGY